MSDRVGDGHGISEPAAVCSGGDDRECRGGAASEWETVKLTLPEERVLVAFLPLEREKERKKEMLVNMLGQLEVTSFVVSSRVFTVGNLFGSCVRANLCSRNLHAEPYISPGPLGHSDVVTSRLSRLFGRCSTTLFSAAT